MPQPIISTQPVYLQTLHPFELQIEHDQLKADFEALKKKMEAMEAVEAKKSPVKSVIDDSDDEVEEMEIA